MRLLAALFLVFPHLGAAEILSAQYVTPTQVYGHGALAAGEHAFLRVELSNGKQLRLGYEDAVFEDTTPRLVDLDADGTPEIVTVVSTFTQGARVQVFDWQNGTVVPVASNAPIGQRHRWLSIAGIADFDGNGSLEVAYVDRSHLAKVLRFLEVSRHGDAWSLAEKASLSGLTNHRIGEDQISGGVRTCGGEPEVVTVNSDWTRVMITQAYQSRDAGPYSGPDSLLEAMNCN